MIYVAGKKFAWIDVHFERFFDSKVLGFCRHLEFLRPYNLSLMILGPYDCFYLNI